MEPKTLTKICMFVAVMWLSVLTYTTTRSITDLNNQYQSLAENAKQDFDDIGKCAEAQLLIMNSIDHLHGEAKCLYGLYLRNKEELKQCLKKPKSTTLKGSLPMWNELQPVGQEF